MAEIKLNLLGLTCGGCVKKVETALAAETQVESFEVSQTQATIKGSLSTEEAIELIENLGFEAES